MSRGSFKAKKSSVSFKRWRAKEYRRMGGVCDCGRRMRLPVSGFVQTSRINWATADHIIEIKNGGSNDYSNLRLICSYCNYKKDKAALLRAMIEGKRNLGRKSKAMRRIEYADRKEEIEIYWRRRILNYPFVKMSLEHIIWRDGYYINY